MGRRASKAIADPRYSIGAQLLSGGAVSEDVVVKGTGDNNSDASTDAAEEYREEYSAAEIEVWTEVSEWASTYLTRLGPRGEHMHAALQSHTNSSMPSMPAHIHTQVVRGVYTTHTRKTPLTLCSAYIRTEYSSPCKVGTPSVG